MGEGKLKEKIRQRDYKLQALLELTKAINANLSQEELLNRYATVLSSNLNIPIFALYLKGKTWNCALHYGMDLDSLPEILDDTFFANKSDLVLNSGTSQANFDLVLPVHNEGDVIAYVLLSDGPEEQLSISPSVKHMKFIQTITGILVVAIENKKLQSETIRQERIKKELELAAEMQSFLLPTNPCKHKNIQTASHYQAFGQVGGDYYDYFFRNENEFVFCMADVSGKGVSAAFVMAGMQAHLHALFNQPSTSLEDIVIQLNDRVNESAQGEKFITCFIGQYDLKSHELKYVNCGHNPAFLQINGHIYALFAQVPGLGMITHLPKFESTCIQLSGNSRILAYTDGLTDLENEENEAFGEKRIEDWLLDTKDDPVQVSLSHLVSASSNFKGSKQYVDDVALLEIRILS